MWANTFKKLYSVFISSFLNGRCIATPQFLKHPVFLLKPLKPCFCLKVTKIFDAKPSGSFSECSFPAHGAAPHCPWHPLPWTHLLLHLADLGLLAAPPITSQRSTSGLPLASCEPPVSPRRPLREPRLRSFTRPLTLRGLHWPAVRPLRLGSEPHPHGFPHATH